MRDWWQRGITQTAFMVVTAIVGTLSAVGGIVASQMLSPGVEEAGGADLHNIQTAVIMLMVDNDLKAIPSPVTTPTSDMSAFPDATTPRPPGLSGFRLYGHDLDGDGVPDVNYVTTQTTRWLYVVDEDGGVTQVEFVPPTPVPLHDN